MKQSIRLWQAAGFAATSIGGVLLHFLYELTNQSLLAAPFSAINESTWEHMKLLFFPMLAFALIQSRFFKEYKNFWCVKLVGIVAGLILIPVLFYTYNGVFGKSPDWINIAIFFVSAAVSYILETKIFKTERPICNNAWICFAVICFIALLFVIFTFVAPQIPIFENP